MKNLKELRHMKKLSQIEAAKACGVSLMTFQMWEREAAKPNPENLKKLEKLLME